MAKTQLMQRLVRLTKIARQADTENASPEEVITHNRRQFLNLSGKATVAATLLAGCSKSNDFYSNSIPASDELKKKYNKSIAIVGGGIAGLNAAFILKQCGLNSTVYEASQRTGGRIFTASGLLNPGIHTELGGEFIDSSHQDMMGLAKLFNLELTDLFAPSELTLKTNIYFFNNIQYTERDFITAIAPYLRTIAKDAASLSDVINYKQHTSTDVSFDNMSLDQYFDKIQLSGWVRELLLVAYLGEFGLNTNVCNSINFLYMFGEGTNGKPALYGESDQRYKVSGGNQKIVDALAKNLNGAIKTGHRLVKIHRLHKKYSLHFFANDGKKILVEADIVLLTLPFSVLRNIEIQVALPDIKRKAIDQLSYGDNSKLLLGFNNRLWRSEYNSSGMCYTDNGLQNGWDGSQLQPGDGGGYTIYLGGDDAVALQQGSADHQADVYLPKLDEIYPGVQQDFNGKAYKMGWSGYPLSKGSYSAYTVGQFTTIAGSEGESVDDLFFAGEHTSYNWQGYMNGGAASGRIAATKIAQQILQEIPFSIPVYAE